MGLTPQEWVKVLQDRLDKGCAGTDRVHKVQEYNDYFDLSSRFRDCFDDLLFLGKLQWRCNLANPRATFLRLSTVAVNAAATLKGLQPKDFLAQAFPFGSATFATYLIENRFVQVLLHCLADLQLWNNSLIDFADRFADAGIIRTMMTGQIPDNWGKVVDQGLRKWAKSPLLPQTYENYMCIILAAQAGAHHDALKHLAKGNELYERRKKDNFRAFSKLDGSAVFNGIMVDHRLAAIVKHCFQQSLPSSLSVDTVHLWKW